jgi:pyridoxamine 5'-phosphate oxidase
LILSLSIRYSTDAFLCYKIEKMNPIADIRKDYKLRSLSEIDVAANPISQFTTWWNEAIASNIDEVNAMTLATADASGRPSARIVLLKGVSENGFEFFTNYESNKGKEMAANNKVALVFFWKELERQIRIEGTVSKLTEAESDEYFLSRPVESRIGAWSSPQSSVIENRDILEGNVLKTTATFDGKEITRPPFWGGYIVKPSCIEFWQGRSNRLHDRIAFFLENDTWSIKRLAP